MPTATTTTVAQHFTGKAASVRAIYTRLLAAARKLGPVKEDPKKTSIHLVRTSAFAGVATRKNGLILTLKSEADVDSPRVKKSEQVSARRWHVEIRIGAPAEIDAELVRWMKRSYELSD